jgi:hypothetical protein
MKGWKEGLRLPLYSRNKEDAKNWKSKSSLNL